MKPEDIILTKIGKKILILRMLRNMTQAELALKCDIEKPVCRELKQVK
jgi:hypothetical protein